ncbi:MAG: hypothetical protein A2Z88_01675 [Omnitrophica WOR_2 bacterium GWA2_47_8]|nr:MAG: hypothetical protein A2Z88_01675 [Omnitrophica WOR_2 bacterium GWA2_47_8]
MRHVMPVKIVLLVPVIAIAAARIQLAMLLLENPALPARRTAEAAGLAAMLSAKPMKNRVLVSLTAPGVAVMPFAARLKIALAVQRIAEPVYAAMETVKLEKIVQTALKIAEFAPHAGMQHVNLVKTALPVMQIAKTIALPAGMQIVKMANHALPARQTAAHADLAAT